MSKTILITGVSSGLGEAMAREALRRGHTVVGTVRREEDRTRFESIAPGKSIGRLLDLERSSEFEALIAQIETDIGPLDVVVNNAGYGLSGAVEELDLDDLRKQFEVNVIGQLAVTQAVLPGMRERRAGHIVNIASMGGVVTFPANGAYHGTKFAILGLSDTLRQEVARFGINVTSILPGLYNTDWGGRSRQHGQRSIDDYDALYNDLARPEMSGNPATLAGVVFDAVESEIPPARLLVGHSAVQLVRQTMAEQAAEIDKWADVSDTNGDG